MSSITADDVSSFRREVLEADRPVVVDFWAPWCGPCRMIGPELDAIAADRPDLKVVKVNIDRNPDVATRYGIQSIPYLALFEHGEVTASSLGAKPRRAIEGALGLHKLGATAAGRPEAGPATAPAAAPRRGVVERVAARVRRRSDGTY